MRLFHNFLVCVLLASAHGGLPAAPQLSTALNAKSSASSRKQADRGRANGVKHFLASALSGAAGVTALAPIEVVRLQLMINKDMSFVGALGSLKDGWFRGNSADTLAAALKVGVTMPAFAFYKRALTRAAVRWGELQEDAPAPRWVAFLAGALAGRSRGVEPRSITGHHPVHWSRASLTPLRGCPRYAAALREQAQRRHLWRIRSTSSARAWRWNVR